MTKTGTKLRDQITADLKRIRSNKTKLATAMAMSNTSADRYLKWLDTGELDDEQKKTLAAGLTKVGLDPLNYMEMPHDHKPVLPTTLLPLLDVFEEDPRLLDALVKILSADDGSREVLRIVAEDRLRRQGK